MQLDAATAFLVVVLVALSLWWHNAIHLEVSLAWSGFSPTYFVAVTNHPEWFAGNYPSGAEEFLKSAPMTIYLLAEKLGVPLMPVMKGMIGLEIALLLGSVVWATRTLRPQATWTAVWLTCLLIIAGRLVEANLARWAHPYYGWTYNFAYAGIFIGVAAAITYRFALAAVALSLAFTAHAVLGLLGAVFAGIVLLAGGRPLPWRQAAIAAAVYGFIAGGWLVFITATSEIASGGIPDHLFVSITRMMNLHWYPIDLGLFWERHGERLIPFLSVSVLLAIYLPDRDGAVRNDSMRIAIGFASMLLITAVGVIIPHWAPNPFLVKLALVRASSIYLILAAPYVVAGLWEDIQNGPAVRAGIAAVLLICPFLVPAGVPVALSVLLALMWIHADLRAVGVTHRVIILGAILAIASALMSWYWVNGVLSGWRNDAYTGINAFASIRWWWFFGLAAFVLWVRRYGAYGLALFVVAIGYFALTWSATMAPLRDAKTLQKAEDYLGVQKWAAAHTPPGTLFMPDPAHYYGWREFSLRPSFGNLREWLHSGWVYNSRSDVFFEGLHRLQALGIDLEAYLKPATGRPVDEYGRMTIDVSARYYGLTRADFLRLSQEFGIKFFVFDKAQRPNPPLPIAYANENFVVATAPDG